MGALDVCPFVPVSDVSMEECVECSRQFGQQLAKEMNVPVYLYEEAQDKEYRKTLSKIRKGEYEGLEEKVQCVNLSASGSSEGVTLYIGTSRIMDEPILLSFVECPLLEVISYRVCIQLDYPYRFVLFQSVLYRKFHFRITGCVTQVYLAVKRS